MDSIDVTPIYPTSYEGSNFWLLIIIILLVAAILGLFIFTAVILNNTVNSINDTVTDVVVVVRNGINDINDNVDKVFDKVIDNFSDNQIITEKLEKVGNNISENAEAVIENIQQNLDNIVN